MTPDEVRDKIREGRRVEPNWFMDRAIVLSTQSDDDSGVLLRAHREALTRPLASSSIKNLVTNYKDRKKVIEYADIGLSVAADVVKDGLRDLPVGRSPTAGLLIGAAKASASVAVDRAKASLVNELHSNSERLLGSQLESYFSRHGNFNNFNDPETSEAAKRELGLKEVYDAARELPGLDPGAHTQVQKLIDERLADAITNGTLNTLRRDKIQDAELKRLAKEDIKIWTALKQNGEETAAQLTELHASIEGLKEELDATTERSLRNEENINSLALILSESLPPTKQKSLIEEGLLEVPEGKRAETLESLDRQIALQKRIDTISHVLNEGQALVSIMNKVKVDEKIAKPIGEAVNIGTAALNAYLSFQGGNPFAGVAALTGLFGGGPGADPDRRVVGMLQRITDKLNDIDEKLKQIIKTQKVIVEKIDALSLSLQEKYESLSSDILFNRMLILDSEIRKLDWLQKLTRDRDSVTVIDYRTGRFPSYREIVNMQRLDNFVGNSPGWSFFDIFNLGDMNEIKPILRVDAHVSEHGKLQKVKEEYGRLHRLLIELAKKSDFDVDRTLVCALMPTDRIRYLDAKVSELENGGGQVGVLKTPYRTPLQELTANLIHVGFLLRATEALLNTHFLTMAFHKEEFRLLTEEEFLEGNLSLRGQQWILGAIRVIDLAILQQSILSGDMLLIFLYRLFDGKLVYPDTDDPHHDLKQQALTVIKENDILRRNVGLYFIRQRLWIRARARGTVYRSYQEALLDPSPERTRLHDLLGTTGPGHVGSGPFWHLIRSDEGQFIRIVNSTLPRDKQDREAVLVPLPPSERIDDKAAEQFYLPGSIHLLLELKKTLCEHDESYRWSETILRDEGGTDVYCALAFLRQES